VLPGDHPLPSERGVESARRVLDAAERAGPDDLVLAVITGGGSALLAAPADPISVGDLRALTSVGAAHVGRVDRRDQRGSEALLGGERRTVGARCRPATTVTLAVSDVIGDPLDTIASGPTVPDPRRTRTRWRSSTGTTSTPPTACASASVQAPTESCRRPRPRATRRSTERGVRRRERANRAGRGGDRRGGPGYEPLVLSASVRGEAREAGTTHAAIAEECAARGSPIEPPAVLLSGGETTVTLGDAADPGTGGPNAEFAASAGLALAEGPLGTEAGAEEGRRRPRPQRPESSSRAPTPTGSTARPTPPELSRTRRRSTPTPPATPSTATTRTHSSTTRARSCGPVRSGTNVNDLRAIVVEKRDGEEGRSL